MLKSFRVLAACLALTLLAACAGTTTKQAPTLPMHPVTEAELTGKVLHQDTAPRWTLKLMPGGKADFGFDGTSQRYPNSTWAVENGTLVVHWKSVTRMTFYGPDADGRYQYTLPKFPGWLYYVRVE